MPGTTEVTGFAESFFRFGPYFLVVLLIATGVGLLINRQPAWLDTRKRFWLSVGFFGASALVSVMALWDWGRQRQNEIVAEAEARAKAIVAEAETRARQLLAQAEADANLIRAIARQDTDRWFVLRIEVSLAGAELAVRDIRLPQPVADDYRALWRIAEEGWRLDLTILGRFPVNERHLPLLYIELDDPAARRRVALPLCLAHVRQADRVEIMMPMDPAGTPRQIGPSLKVLAGGHELRAETCPLRGA